MPYDTASPRPTPLPSGFGREERVENLGQVFRRNPFAVVRHREGYSLVDPGCGDGHQPLGLGLRGLRRIQQQVEDHLLDLRGVAGHRRQILRQVRRPPSRCSASSCAAPAKGSCARCVFRSAGARCGFERREKASRSLTMRPTREVSLVTCARYLRNSSMRSGRNAVVLQHALQQHGEVEHAGNGVVDFVRHAGRKLAQRRQAVGLQQLLLRRLELLRALFHLGFQVLGELVDLRRARCAGGRASRRRSAPVRPVPRCCRTMSSGLSSSIWLTALVPSISLSMGRARKRRVKIDDEQADQRDFHAGDQQHAELHAGHFAVDAFQVERQVEHAEDLHAARMGVAGGLAAGRLVIDGGHASPAGGGRPAAETR